MPNNNKIFQLIIDENEPIFGTLLDENGNELLKVILNDAEARYNEDCM